MKFRLVYKYKRPVALLLLVTLLTVMVGCGSRPEVTEESSATPTVTPTVTETPTPTETPAPTATATPTPTASPTPTAATAAPTQPLLEEGFEDGLTGIMSIPNWSESIEVPIVYDYVISKVKTAVNVRKEPNTDSEIVGKFRVNSYAKIIERLEGWTLITSGDVTGYVSNDYLYMDEEAIALVDSLDAFSVIIRAGKMNVREEPNTNCAIIGSALGGQEYTWYPELSDDNWFAIQYTDEKIAYVSAAYTETKSKLDKALTMAQEEARARADMFAKAMEYSKKHPPSQVNRAPINLTDEELYLMAVVIAMEALDEPYEGKLMVANVIVNRILNGYWGKTLKEVVYAPGQFTGANSGRVEAFWNRANEDCKRAAYEAAMGNNNIGDFLFFISIGKAKFDLYTKYYVFHGHCFYARNW